MKIALVSDLHLEFGDCFFNNTEAADVLVLAGDICVAGHIQQFPFDTTVADSKNHDYQASMRYKKFFERVSKEFPLVLMVIGNHEFYGCNIGIAKTALKENLSQIADNIVLMDNDSIVHNGVRFVGATLWTDLNKQDPVTMWSIRTYMTDYRVISTDHSKLMPEDTVQMHQQSIDYIRQICASDTESTIVVISHHAPSMLSIHPRYVKDPIANGAYASDLSALIMDNPNIKTWVHGHVHTPFNYPIGECIVKCNPRGYLGHETEDIQFAPIFFDV